MIPYTFSWIITMATLNICGKNPIEQFQNLYEYVSRLNQSIKMMFLVCIKLLFQRLITFAAKLHATAKLRTNCSTKFRIVFSRRDFVNIDLTRSSFVSLFLCSCCRLNLQKRLEVIFGIKTWKTCLIKKGFIKCASALYYQTADCCSFETRCILSNIAFTYQ